MRAVDTNVLVRLLVRDDPRQLRAAEEFVKPGAWISHLVLLEATWVLDSVYEVPPDRIAAALAMLLDHECLSVQDSDVVRAALTVYQKRPALGFSSCLILETARRAGHLPLATFDQALSKVEGTKLL